MDTMTQILHQARSLSMQDQKELVKQLIDILGEQDTPEKEHSLLELAGLGAEIWQGMDAQAYVNQLRDEWDRRS